MCYPEMGVEAMVVDSKKVAIPVFIPWLHDSSTT
jgi:hypothetical protein